MTFPPTSPSDHESARSPAPAIALGVAAVLIALNAFALGASGSVSALAGLTAAVLASISIATSAFAPRWRAALPVLSDATADAMALLFQSGLAMASATFVGAVALVGIFDPRVIGSGVWAVVAVLVALGISIAAVTFKGRRGFDPVPNISSYADAVPGLVVLIGVSAGTMLNAAGLDAAAALVVSVWIFWGAIAPIRTAARLLTRE